MRLIVGDQPRRPSAVVVGSWDPLLPAHDALFGELCTYACRHALLPLVVAIAPDPGVYLLGRASFPVYTDPGTRWRALREGHAITLAPLRFTRADLARGAADFLRVLDRVTEVRELWLGAGQTLGMGPGGAPATIQALCDERRIALRWLPPVAMPTGRVRRALREGRLGEACRLVGRPPLRQRPASRVLRLAWCPGRYTAVPVASPTARPTATPLTLDLLPDDCGLPTAGWPDDAIPYLAFVKGPGDDQGPEPPGQYASPAA
jgi:hypothetical protein